MNKLNCFAPYGHYHLDVHGYAKPCCWWLIDPKKKLSEFSRLEEIGKYFADLMLDDKLLDTSCSKCILYEQKGTTSLKNIIYRNVQEKDELHRPVEIEVSLDSICNFACVICDGARSSKWRSLQSRVEWTPKQNSEDPNHFENVMRLLSNSDLSQLKEIKMLGGEPFYTKNFIKFIDLIKEKCNIDNITLMITTNLSVFPADELFNVLLQFKRLKILASLDGVGSTAQVVRFGTKWNKVEENLLRWISINRQFPRKKMQLTIAPTFSLYNLEHVEDLKNWYVKHINFKCPIVFTLAREPYLTIENLDKKYREKFDENGFSDPMWLVNQDFFGKWPTKEQINYQLIYKYIETYSNITGIDIASTIPRTMEQLKRQQDVSI